MNKPLTRKTLPTRRCALGVLLAAPAVLFPLPAVAAQRPESVARAITALRTPNPGVHTVATAQDMARIADMLEFDR